MGDCVVTVYRKGVPGLLAVGLARFCVRAGFFLFLFVGPGVYVFRALGHVLLVHRVFSALCGGLCIPCWGELGVVVVWNWCWCFALRNASGRPVGGLVGGPAFG